MNDRMLESLSALLDNETNELELERILATVSGDSQLRQVWMRYNLAQHALHGHSTAHPDWDISTRVQTALDSTQAVGASPVRQRMLRSLQSFAVAASVAATVVFGGRHLANVSETATYVADSSGAASASPVGMLNSLGASAVQASYGTQPVAVLPPATRTVYQDYAQQRLRKYMQEHAEQAALNSPQGLVPFARVPQIRE
jgi:sigma-E factor negative regulatory protein RseA